MEYYFDEIVNDKIKDSDILLSTFIIKSFDKIQSDLFNEKELCLLSITNILNQLKDYEYNILF